MAHNYSNEELADLHFMYGLANGNSRAAERLYAERFPNRHAPSRKIFATIHRNLRERGMFKCNEKVGRPISVSTIDVEERILEVVEREPESSVRGLSVTQDIPKSTIWKILHKYQLYPYHFQRVQCLLERDFQPRVDLCQWFLRQIALLPYFVSNILFTDEAGFSRDGIFNFHNNHVWADDNPHATITGRHQHKFSVNVWVGIVGDSLLGPVFLPDRLTGDAYVNFLRTDLIDCLDTLPLNVRQNMWFMQDGAPPHFSLIAREYLTQAFHGKVISRGSPVAWPARSPDLNPLDFFLWGYLKSLVYRNPIESVDELKERIIMSCETIRRIPGVFERVRKSMTKRLNRCIEMHGGHIEHLL